MHLQWHEIRARAAKFSEDWKAATRESADKHTFWNEFFECFGVSRKQVGTYEKRVRNFDLDKQGFIDLFMPGTLIVEQKSAGLDLRSANKQALDYYDWLPEAERPRYILTCDFQRWDLTDLESGQEWRFTLSELKKHVEAFAFIVGTPRRQFRNQKPANPKASELLGKLHEQLAEQGYTGHRLQLLLVRLLFILFADDTGIWPKDQFLVLLEQRTSADGRDLGRWLTELFEVLDTPEDQRQSGLDGDLAAFPHINGKLFEERIGTAVFDNALRDILLDASAFNWGSVSPAIFGSLFESVIDKLTRRKQGAHYTPEEAILKVIGPLFLDELWAEFDKLKRRKDGGRRGALMAFHDKLAGLTFFDPACGAGNFLVVTYRELRELEAALLKELFPPGERLALGVEVLSKLDVNRFYGIEIDEFPSQIAQVALWMTDHIANTNLGDIYGKPFARIPLVTAPNIRHGDALELNWRDVLPAERCSYVFGNPPFVGAKYQSDEQRAQVRRIAKHGGSGGTLDYVAAWFLKAGDYAQEAGSVISPLPIGEGSGEGVPPSRASNTPTQPSPSRGRAFADPPRIAFVATNSICQGEQVAQLWPKLFNERRLEIAFAHRTFVWPGRAAVHCVIVGLAQRGAEPAEKRLFSYRADGKGDPTETRHEWLTAYLFGADEGQRHGVVESARSPLAADKPLIIGSKPIDGGHYIFDAAQRAALSSTDPEAMPFLRPYVGAEEYINGGERWIFALQEASPAALGRSPTVSERVRRVRALREQSRSAPTRELSKTPLLFHVNVIPKEPFLVIPKVSSERRNYVPIGWLEPPTVPSDLVFVLEHATTYDFAILTSATHMAWLRHIGGRLKSDYRYSIGLVYNTFPWPETTPAQRARIEALAQAVLDARALPKNATSTLADLYDPDRMPPELYRAHKALDAAVDKLYAPKGFTDDRARIEHLFRRYEALVMPTAAAPAANRRTLRRVAREAR